MRQNSLIFWFENEKLNENNEKNVFVLSTHFCWVSFVSDYKPLLCEAELLWTPCHQPHFPKCVGFCLKPVDFTAKLKNLILFLVFIADGMEFTLKSTFSCAEPLRSVKTLNWNRVDNWDQCFGNEFLTPKAWTCSFQLILQTFRYASGRTDKKNHCMIPIWKIIDDWLTTVQLRFLAHFNGVHYPKKQKAWTNLHF